MARPTEGRTFLPGEASGAFCATAFFEEWSSSSSKTNNGLWPLVILIIIFISALTLLPLKNWKIIWYSLIVSVCFNYKYEITHPCCIWASSGNDDTDRWRMISLEEGHWPFGFLSDYHQREEKPRENQWSSVLPYGASSSTTKQNQGGFRFAEGLVVTVSSLKVPTDNLLEEKTWGAIMKRQPGWIVLKMGRSLVSLGNFDLTSLWFKRSVILIIIVCR